MLRLLWVDGNKSLGEPLLTDVKCRRWIRELIPGNATVQVVPGWDSANDANSDGYVDHNERMNLVNPMATARFRHEARATPLGRMWSVSSRLLESIQKKKTMHASEC